MTSTPSPMVDPEIHAEVSHKSMKPQLQNLLLCKGFRSPSLQRVDLSGETGGDDLIPMEIRS